MAEFKGSSSDFNRLLRLQHEREKQMKDLEERKRKIDQEGSTQVISIHQKFSANVDTTLDDLKNEAIGLYTKEEFQRKRQKTEREKKEKEEKEKEERFPICSHFFYRATHTVFFCQGEEDTEKRGRKEEEERVEEQAVFRS